MYLPSPIMNEDWRFSITERHSRCWKTFLYDKDRKAEYIESLIATRENDDIEPFHNFMSDGHIRNLEQTIRNYQASIEDEGLEPRVDVGINVGTNKFMHAAAAFA